MYPNQKLIDNRELATLNTAIFNNWYKELKDLVKSKGGTAKLNDEPDFLHDFKIEFDAEKGIIHKF